MAIERRCIEFVPWKPGRPVFVPDEELFSLKDFYIASEMADEELIWIIMKVINEN